MTDRVAELERASTGAVGTVALLSANPIHDTGGGQRSAQLALELLDRGYAVVFVSHGEVTETVDLELRYDHPRLVRWPLSRAVAEPVRERLVAAAAAGEGMVLTQVPVRPWLPVVEAAVDAGVPTVYDCIDRWASELGRGWYRRDVEAETARASSVLTASAPALVDHVERLTGRETRLVPNAFNARIFSSDPSPARPDDVPAEGRVAVYVGALWGGWMDWALVDAAARALPDTTFVFVGDHRGEGRGLPENCRFSGLRPQTELPGYLAHADVALLPWEVSDVTRATSPLKVYEYVAMGLPVVSPDLEPLRGIPGVHTVEGRDDFIASLRARGRDGLPADEAAEMRRFSRANSWKRRVDDLLELVDAPSPSAGPAVRGGASISVVVPAFQHAAYVGRSLDSVRIQTLPAAEVVVVDDGSTDGTAEEVARRAEAFAGSDGPPIRLVRQQNRGAHAALNRAIRLSRGDWVAVLNSDDLFTPERLERAFGVARETGAALVCGSVRLVDENGAEAVDPEHPIADWYAEAREWAAARPAASVFRRHNLAVTTSNFFMHRTLWERLGGFRAYRYVHDWDFILRALELHPHGVVWEPSLEEVLYRVHGTNTISESDEGAAAERAEMLERLRRPWGRIKRAVSGWRSRRQLAATTEASGALAPVVRAPIGRGVPRGEALTGRVGLVVDDLGTGGLEEVVALMAQALPALGVETTVLCVGAEGRVARRLRRVGIDVHGARGRAEVVGWARRERVAVASSHFAPVEVVTQLADAGVPVVETVQNCYVWLTDEGWARERDRVEAVSSVVAVSSLAAGYYRRHTGHEPEHVVPNAVNPARAAVVPTRFARSRLDLPPEVPVLAFLGRITEQKNPAGLLRAFARARASGSEAVLVLAGPADGSGHLSLLRRRHHDLFRSGAIRHLPQARHVGTVLSAADAFVSNAFYEGWSVAASEACWVGRPVIVSETGGSAAITGTDGARGILVPNPVGDPLSVRQGDLAKAAVEGAVENEEAMAAAMVSLASAREDWRGRRDAIRAWARSEVSPQALASRYLQVFRRAADGDASARR